MLQNAANNISLRVRAAYGRAGNHFDVRRDAEFFTDSLGVNLRFGRGNEGAYAPFLQALQHGDDAVEGPVFKLAYRAVALLEMSVRFPRLFLGKSKGIAKRRDQGRPDDNMLIQPAFRRFSHLYEGIFNGLDDSFLRISQRAV